MIRANDIAQSALAMRRGVWNTYKTTGYTHDVSGDQSSAGGVHHHQVRQSRIGWQKRICQSNGNYVSYGPAVLISAEDGEALFAMARQY